MALNLGSASQSNTHDVSRTSYHLQDLETFGEIVTNAAAAAFPNSRKSRYRYAYALLLSWEDDELGVKSEVEELDDVFSQTYYFHTEQWRIPSANSHNALAFRLMDFLKDYATPEHLLVIYYGGHGSMNDDRQCIWSCNETVDSPTIQWYGLQTMLEQSESDVLVLLDCCAAASSNAASGKGVTELIAACGFESWAPGVGEHSFSRSLIEELKYLSYGTPFSVALLHNKVLSRIKYWKPRYTSALASERRKTPVYIQLANEMNRRSIELCPMFSELINFDFGLSPQAATHPSGPSSASDDVDMLDSDTSQFSMAQVWPDPNFESPKVLISVALEDDQRLRPDDWTEWLTSIPALARYMKIQGVYKSDSTVILGLMPVAIWDLLPENAAISFVCFVKSENMLDIPLTRPATLSKTELNIKAEKVAHEVRKDDSTSRTPRYPKTLERLGSAAQHRVADSPSSSSLSSPLSSPSPSIKEEENSQQSEEEGGEQSREKTNSPGGSPQAGASRAAVDESTQAGVKKSRVASKGAKGKKPIMTLPGVMDDLWYCGWCKYGPMNFATTEFCVNCVRRRNIYAQPRGN
ncbi:MAG: hypothetical protein Q9173_000617 [Seirophora scorigena]